MPIGGIGTGTVSLSGRGALRDWEIVNRPAKGFYPTFCRRCAPFFALYAKPEGGEPVARAVEGPLPSHGYEGAHGSPTPNHGLPRFRECRFAAAYPLGQVMLSDPDVPVDVRIEAFNPLVPCDADRSGIPVAILRFVIANKTDGAVDISLCGTMLNFIGADGTVDRSKANKNEFREGKGICGIFMYSDGVDRNAEQWGTMALAALETEGISHRTNWLNVGWGDSLLDFWDDFSSDGVLEERQVDKPICSLAVEKQIPPRGTDSVTFLLTWHFPNRQTWTPREGADNRMGNYYATLYRDAWDVAEKVAEQMDELEAETVKFVRAFCESDLPDVVKEAALFNISTLRTQTCFRTEDGRFFGFEGCNDRVGCCLGSCTHVWNYEQATAFLFGELAKSMREVEFAFATRDNGHMSFRVHLPLSCATNFGHAAADGQMGCLIKLYRDWQLSGDDEMLKKLWGKARKALEFCWIKGGWDADMDGVMEGCQHNTMDVEYYGPNPQMTGWYLGALRAAEEMARYLGDDDFARKCRKLFENGSRWMDDNLFNGEYYEHEIRLPESDTEIADGLRFHGDLHHQLGAACLVDQLVGQYMAHITGLGYLHDREKVVTTLRSILKYNLKRGFYDHFNPNRSYVIGDECALLMASYPRGRRPERPFPYFAEVMTGFEYTAAVHMIYEGMVEEGLQCISAIRARYDGRKRNPFNEAECGHHYARAMASWAAVLALTGFRYSGVTQSMWFAPKEGKYFWSNGYAWGTCLLRSASEGFEVELQVMGGKLSLSRFVLADFGEHSFGEVMKLSAGDEVRFIVNAAS